MAKVTPIVETLVTVIPKGATLKLSQKEIEVLLVVFNNIGGSPDTTARGVIDGIRVAFNEQGFKSNFEDPYDSQGSIYFTK
jgi:hypothetical protein